MVDTSVRDGGETVPTRPITPEEVTDLKLSSIPDVVIATVNQLIIENINVGRAVVKQKTIVERLVVAGLLAAEIYERGWLNIEDVYRTWGWEVGYEKPDFNNPGGAAFFEFTVPRQKR